MHSRTVSLWLANDPTLHGFAKGIAEDNRPLSTSEEDWVANVAHDLEEWASDQFESFDNPQPFRELLANSLSEVDWESVAEDFCEDWEDPEDEDDEE